jgi:hypothetical protein
MSSKLLPLAEIREKYKRMAIAGEVRGFESVPFQTNATTSTARLYKQAKPTWTTIVATDATFNSTFASGVEGVLSSTKPNGAVDDFPLDRKLTAVLSAERSVDNGVSWVSFTPTINQTTNTVTLTNEPAANIVLIHYETQAHFTETASASTVLALGTTVFATESNTNALLVSTLKGTISVGTADSETLSITKRVGNVVTHTAEGITEDILVTTYLTESNRVARLMFNYDNSGVIDGVQQQSLDTQYFVVEE